MTPADAAATTHRGRRTELQLRPRSRPGPSPALSQLGDELLEGSRAARCNVLLRARQRLVESRELSLVELVIFVEVRVRVDASRLEHPLEVPARRQKLVTGELV